MQDARTPVIVVSGFLGSGKTTLLRKVLGTPELANSMLIVNEIGEIGIDHQLFERSDDETVLLDNGCMCCQLRGDLQALLVDLGMRRYRGELPSFERVFIETSGLAEPGPIAQTLYGDGPLAKDYRLAHVVTLVDPLNPEARDAAPAVATAQLVAADLVAITKTDAANAGQIEAAREWVSSVNSFAKVILVVQGDIDIALLAEATPFDHPALTQRSQGLFSSVASIQEDGDASTSDAQAAGAYLGRQRSLHPSNVQSFVLDLGETPLDRKLFDLFMNSLLRLRGQDLLRVKGIVKFKDTPDPQLIQGVCHVYDQPVPFPDPGQARGSVLVIIARGIARKQVEAYWQALHELAG